VTGTHKASRLLEGEEETVNLRRSDAPAPQAGGGRARAGDRHGEGVAGGVEPAPALLEGLGTPIAPAAPATPPGLGNRDPEQSYKKCGKVRSSGSAPG